MVRFFFFICVHLSNSYLTSFLLLFFSSFFLGIHTALQHDTIICNSENGGNRFRIENEARAKADLALEAIKKSRLNKWQW